MTNISRKILRFRKQGARCTCRNTNTVILIMHHHLKLLNASILLSYILAPRLFQRGNSSKHILTHKHVKRQNLKISPYSLLLNNFTNRATESIYKSTKKKTLVTCGAPSQP